MGINTSSQTQNSPESNEEYKENILNKTERFLSYRRSETTVRSYVSRCRHYLKVVELNKTFEQSTVDEYLSTSKSKGNSSNSIRTDFYALKSMFKAHGVSWGFSEDDVPPTEQPRYDHAFNKKELERLLRASEDLGKVPHLAVLIARNTGMRRIEICRLNLEDYLPDDPDGPCLLCRHPAKKNMVAKKFIGSELKTLLDDWIKFRNRKRAERHRATLNSPLLVTRNWSRYNEKALSKLLARVIERAQIPTERDGQKLRRGWHGFRRSRTAELGNNGVSLRNIVATMGWSNANMVFRYWKKPDSEVIEDLRLHDPLLRVNQGPLIVNGSKLEQVENSISTSVTSLLARQTETVIDKTIITQQKSTNIETKMPDSLKPKDKVSKTLIPSGFAKMDFQNFKPKLSTKPFEKERDQGNDNIPNE